MSMTLDWNGKDLPEQLKHLPPGRYVITGTDEPLELSDEEAQGIRAALEEVERGQVVPQDEAVRRLRGRLAARADGE